MTSGAIGDAFLGLLTELLDAEMHDVAGLQEKLWLHAETDARRRAGGDHVARLEHHELADIGDEMLDAEDHRLGRAGLAALAAHIEEHREVLGVRHLVGGDEPGPDRPEGRRALALGPLAGALSLPSALR